MSDEDGIIQYTNAAAEDAMFGYDARRVVEHPSRFRPRARIGRITAKYFGNCKPAGVMVRTSN